MAQRLVSHLAGCPGPPPYFLREEEDEMIIGGEPDDLGDLMQEMREGAAWAEGLAMEAELPLCAPAGASGGSGSLAFGSPAQAAQAAAPSMQPGSIRAEAAADGSQLAADGAAPTSCGAAPTSGAGMEVVEEERRQLQVEHDTITGLQPAVRALLMHPGGAGVGHFMIPVAASAARGGDASCPPEAEAPRTSPPPSSSGGPSASPMGMSCAAGLASGPQGSQPGWAAPQGPSGYYSQPSAYYPMTVAAPPALASSATPFTYYQPPPPSFAQPPPTAAQQQQQQQQQAVDAMALMSWQQQHGGGAGAHQLSLPQMYPQGGAYRSGYPPMPMPQSNHTNTSGGSGSDGTTLHLRSGFEGDSGGSGCSGSHNAGRNSSGQLPAAVVPQLCAAAPALAAFERADTVVVLKCEASSDSSDCEDHGARDLYESSAQVVPDVMAFPTPSSAPPALTAALPVLPLPPGAPMLSLGPFGPTVDFPPLPCAYYDTPAAQTARMARLASLERYRLKKARRSSAKKIRYVARKLNADKRPRIKGRFIKAGEAADMLAAAAAEPSSPCESQLETAGTMSESATLL